MGVLHGSELTQIGAGSVGSHLAYRLSPAGLRLNLLDSGTVKAKHTEHGRTIYAATQIGMKKVHAAKQKLEREFPGTKINAYAYGTAEVPDSEFKSMFARSLVVILVIDDGPEILRLAALAYPITEFIHAAMHRNGDSGHVAISVPFVTPCLQCTLGISQATDIRTLTSEPANSLDIIQIAEYSARMALDIAHSKVTGRRISRWDTSKNLIYIANTREELSPDGPGVHYEATSQRRPGCVVCDHQMPS
jgi:molybdopterin/thiamine biosynthesis adenylyltransferase